MVDVRQRFQVSLILRSLLDFKESWAHRFRFRTRRELIDCWMLTVRGAHTLEKAWRCCSASHDVMVHPVDGALRGGAVQALFHGKALSRTLKVEVSGPAQSFCRVRISLTRRLKPLIQRRSSCHQSELISVELMVCAWSLHVTVGDSIMQTLH